MAKLKTQPNEEDVLTYLQGIEPENRRADCLRTLELMREITGAEPKMWGSSIIGFGSYHYRYASGREGDWFLTGFAPRKQNLTLYIMAGFDRYEDLMSKLGQYKTGKSCLYLKSLKDVDEAVLRELIAASVQHLKNKYPSKPA